MMLAALASRKWDKLRSEPIPLTNRVDLRPSQPTGGSGYTVNMQNASYQGMRFEFEPQEVDYIAVSGTTTVSVNVTCGAAVRTFTAAESPFTEVIYVGEVVGSLMINEPTSKSTVTAVPMRTVTA